MNAFDRNVVHLTSLLLPIMRYRVEKLGLEESGAFNFYRSRLESGRVFCDYEIRLVQAVIERMPSPLEVHEIGCGWGQLVFLLAWCGYRTTGFEIDIRRFRGGEFLHRLLCQIDPECGERAVIRNEFFPPLDRPDPARSLAIATNVVVSNPQFVEEQMLWALRRYRYAVLDIDRFCRLRQQEERPAFIAGVERMGLRDRGLFCDAGADGQFHLFEADAADRA